MLSREDTDHFPPLQGTLLHVVLAPVNNHRWNSKDPQDRIEDRAVMRQSAVPELHVIHSETSDT